MSNLSARLRDFFFFPVDSRTSAYLRLSLAAFLLFVFWPRGLEPAGWFAANPVSVVLYDSVVLTDGYRLVLLALLIAFALGWRSPGPGLALSALLVPLAFLNEGNQSRQILVFTTLCVALLPAVPLWRARRESARLGPIWPVRLLQIQLSALYGVNALAKLTPAYLSGERLMQLSTQPNFRVDLADGVLDLGPIAIPVAACAIATVATEAWLAIGFWFQRTRWMTAAVGLAFHGVLKLVITIFMLDLASIYLYLSFLLPWRDRRSQQRVRNPERIHQRHGHRAKPPQ